MSAGENLKVFVSYSREDLAFADQLVLALEGLGYQPAIDRQGIAPGEDWRQRLGQLIRSTDTVIFVLSKSSAESEICHWEVEQTARLGKRLIPVVCETLNNADVPAHLQDLNYIMFCSDPKMPDAGFGKGIRDLNEALRTDFEWTRDQARLAELAARWEDGHEAEDLLLRGSQLTYYTEWLQRKPLNASELSHLQLRYLRASEDAEAFRENEQRKQLEERERITRRLRSLTVYGMIFVAALGVLALFGGYQAVQMSVTASMQTSRLFAQQAEQLNRLELYDKGLLFALVGDPVGKSNPFQVEINQSARAQLERSLIHSNLYRYFSGHDAEVFDGAFSPDGTVVATASVNKIVQLWDVSTGKEIMTLEGHNGGVETVKFNSDGTSVLTTSWDGTAKLWDANSGEEIATYKGHKGSVFHATFSADEKYVLTASGDTTAKLWNVNSGDELMSYEGHTDSVRVVLFTPDDKLVVTVSEDDTAKVWQMKTGKLLRTLGGHTGDLYSGDISPNGELLITASRDASAKIWTIETGELVHSLKGHERYLVDALFSPDGALALTASGDGLAILWDVETGTEIERLEGHDGFVRVARFSSDGDRILTSSEGGEVKLWSEGFHGISSTLLGKHEEAVWQAIFSPDGNQVLSTSKDGSAKIWKIPGQEVTLHSTQSVLLMLGDRAAFSPDGTKIVTTSLSAGNPRPYVWETKTGQFLKSLGGHRQAVFHLAFGREGSHIATASADGTVRLWDAVSATPIWQMDEHTDQVSYATFSPNGELIASASFDATTKIIDVQSGSVLHTLKGHKSQIRYVSFSPDGSIVATSSVDETVRLWNVDTGEEVRVLSLEGAGVQAEFTPDGKKIATLSVSTAEDNFTGVARLWDAGSGHALCSWPDASFLFQLVVLPNGMNAILSSLDGPTKMVELSTCKENWTRNFGESVVHVTIDPSGTIAASVGLDSVVVWNIESSQIMHGFNFENGVHSVFSPDGRMLLATDATGSATLWNISNGETVLTLEADRTLIFPEVAVSPNNGKVATSFGGNDAKIWSMPDFESIELDGHSREITSINFSSDGSRVVTASEDGGVVVWDTETGEILRQLWGHKDVVVDAKFGSSSEIVISSSIDDTTKIWDVAAGKERSTLVGHTRNVLSLTVDRKNSKIATTSSDMTAIVWNEKTGEKLATLKGHLGSVGKASFSPDGSSLVTASSDHTARIWNVVSGDEIRVLDAHTGPVTIAEYSPDGGLILTASYDDSAIVWDAGTGGKLRVLSGHTDDILHATFSPDGTKVITASNDDTARLWDVRSGKLIADYKRHTEDVTYAIFSPDSSKVIVASKDRSATIWDLDPILFKNVDDQVKQACQLLASNGFDRFSQQDYSRFTILEGALDRPCEGYVN